jgi:D-alanyl-D-alanine carboxypeptidase
MLTTWGISLAYGKPHTSWQRDAPLNGGMAYIEPARSTTRSIPGILVAGLLVVIAAIAAARGFQLPASSSSPVASPISFSTTAPPNDVRRSEQRGALGEADGVVPDGTTVFDDEIPGVANLDPALLGALRRAATDAADEAIEFFVNSGWRSPEYQEQLLLGAVSKYGSETKAARWVGTPTTSAHVSGDAVDLGPFDATAWLSKHGAKYGLCQIYRNEPWHYELRPEAINHACPPMYADPTHDPRMQQ